MEKKKIQKGEVVVKGDSMEDPIMTFNSKKLKEKCVDIIEFVLNKIKYSFKTIKEFFVKVNSKIDYDENKAVEVGKNNVKKVFNFIINIVKLIILKAWKIFKVLLLIIILLSIGVLGGIYYGVQNPDKIDNWIRIGVDISNEPNFETEFKSFSYEGFGVVYLDKNVSNYKQISESFRNGEINYSRTDYSGFAYIYDDDQDCYEKLINENKFEVCNYKSYFVNKYFNKVWIFETEYIGRVYEYKNRYDREDEWYYE